jgi:transposase-like protein
MFKILQGLINAVEKVFPDAEHKFCVRHMIQNFQRAGHRGETLKNDIWAIVRSTSVPKRKRNMDKLKTDSGGAYNWVEQLVPTAWIKSFLVNSPSVTCC